MFANVESEGEEGEDRVPVLCGLVTDDVRGHRGRQNTHIRRIAAVQGASKQQLHFQEERKRGTL